MIKHLYKGSKVTANQLAKQVVLDAIDARACDPLDCHSEADKMTDKERADFQEAFDKQVARVEKFLGL
jgi:hypothetical protein